MGKRRTLRMEFDTKMIAKAMTINCVRNTILERYHQQGKLSDDDMKAFNKQVVNRIYTFLDCLNNRSATERNLFLAKMVATSEAFTAKWDELEFDGDLWQGVQAHLEKMQQIQRMKDEARALNQAPGQPISSTPTDPPPSKH
jgi:hypothetical protein